MVQLCLWIKIRTKQWLGLCASAFQCMRAGFLCSKCNNFACLHTRQDQNELHLKRWFFLTKLASSLKIDCKPTSQRYSSVYTTIFIRWKNKTNYLSNQTWAKCYHSRNKHELEKKVRWRTIYFLQTVLIRKNCYFGTRLSSIYTIRIGTQWHRQSLNWRSWRLIDVFSHKLNYRRGWNKVMSDSYFLLKRVTLRRFDYIFSSIYNSTIKCKPIKRQTFYQQLSEE